MGSVLTWVLSWIVVVAVGLSPILTVFTGTLLRRKAGTTPAGWGMLAGRNNHGGRSREPPALASLGSTDASHLRHG
jgi:hypothetical protein